MVAYGVDVFPLIKQPKMAYLDVTQPWYADYAGALSMYDTIELYFNLLKQFGLGRGFPPKTSKIILIANPYNIKTRKLFGLCHGFKV